MGEMPLRQRYKLNLCGSLTPSPPQGCPEAQPGLQAQEAPPAAGPRRPRSLRLPHGLQWGPAAVAAPCAPLPAQDHLQGQGQPQQCRKGRPCPDLGVTLGGGTRLGCPGRGGMGSGRWRACFLLLGWTRLVRAQMGRRRPRPTVTALGGGREPGRLWWAYREWGGVPGARAGLSVGWDGQIGRASCRERVASPV